MTSNHAKITYVSLFVLYLDIDIHFTISYLMVVDVKATSTKKHI